MLTAAFRHRNPIMRPPRIIIATAFSLTIVFLTFLSLRASNTPQTIANSPPAKPKTAIQAFFSFQAPFSLFPPNAIITLTNDNTTAFLARPAAFGPLLPVHGLKGQLWIGSGFGDDDIRQGSVTAGAEGELGCSDVPGWVDTSAKSSVAEEEISANTKSTAVPAKAKPQSRGRDKDEDGPFNDQAADSRNSKKGASKSIGPPANDGTDDYLHHPLPESTVSKPTDKTPAESKGDHADIQSIQEGAEITGRVVLLSRGGCGFLEKVKWAQRRGAIALIVGDDTKGGPLIQMYARGDTSNVTIPAVFTSRTTAHILSTLMGPDSFIEDTIDENGKPVLSVKHSGKGRKSRKKQGSNPTFTPTATANTVVETGRPASKASNKKASTRTKETSAALTTERPSWLRSLFGIRGSDSKSSRPPSSGQLGWALVDDWKDDDDDFGFKKVTAKPTKKTNEKAVTDKKPPTEGKPKPETVSQQTSGDDFIIGVQDWRDPDLVGSSGGKDTDTTAEVAKSAGKADTTNKKATPAKAAPKKHLGGALQEIPEYIPPLRGGSTTPGSGEYNTKDSPSGEKSREKSSQQDAAAEGKSASLLAAFFGDDEENVEFLSTGSEADLEEDVYDEDEEYEGLWVTLTPTSGASPFLDTLLVLVVSPLVTLTVVYALLLIRSRIRRRRWRAPKSVVERLPVRTYQTIVPSGNQTPRLPSPTSSSATTPLLQQSPPMRSRPRSRTTTGVPEPGDLIRVNSNPLQLPSLPPRVPDHEKHEKHGNDTSEWKKHMGKQVECVVCLEDYIDGVSRVMSLPCGHEFHVECM